MPNNVNPTGTPNPSPAPQPPNEAPGKKAGGHHENLSDEHCAELDAKGNIDESAFDKLSADEQAYFDEIIVDGVKKFVPKHMKDADSNPGNNNV